MPELPEVETVRRGLERCVVGRRITGVEVANPKVLKGQAEPIFRARVTGRRIEQVARRGKYLLVTLGAAEAAIETLSPTADTDVSFTLCLHLKMRGQVRVSDAAAPIEPYLCVSLLLDDGSVIRFHDMWTWGEIRVLTPEELKAVSGLAGMGPEPLEAGWNGAMLAGRIGSRRTAIKPTLLDQAIVAGVGNIYADESLFRAKVHPQRVASSLSADELEVLARAIRTVLAEAVEAGGTTSEEFVDVSGSIGGFRPHVYDRGGKACHHCGTTLTRIRLGGRGTVFCEGCQPLP